MKFENRMQGLDEANERHLPLLDDVEGPVELEVGLLVIIDEGGCSGVVTTSDHTGWGIFFSNCEEKAYVSLKVKAVWSGKGCEY